jgi:hypothetical protein
MITTNEMEKVAETTLTGEALADNAALVVAQNRARTVAGSKLRTDIHRPGAIQPHMYTSLGWYALASKRGKILMAKVDAWMGSEESIDFEALVYGDWGKCGICGAQFVYGEVWQHNETLDVVHVGHDCADTYKLTSGTDWTAIMDQRARFLKAEKTRIANEAFRAEVLAKHPGFEAALECPAGYVQGIKRTFFSSSPRISDYQIATVFRIAAEHAARQARPEEVKVAAPVVAGRTTVKGVVVSKKTHESVYGSKLVMTVKVTTEAGVWLAWGTVPANLLGSLQNGEGVKVGDTVEFEAQLQAGREPHFAFFKRPTKAAIVARAAA